MGQRREENSFKVIGPKKNEVMHFKSKAVSKVSD